MSEMGTATLGSRSFADRAGNKTRRESRRDRHQQRRLDIVQRRAITVLRPRPPRFSRRRASSFELGSNARTRLTVEMMFAPAAAR